MKIKNDFLHKLETLNKKEKKTDKNMFKISFNILYNFSLKRINRNDLFQNIDYHFICNFAIFEWNDSV